MNKSFSFGFNKSMSTCKLVPGVPGFARAKVDKKKSPQFFGAIWYRFGIDLVFPIFSGGMFSPILQLFS